MRYLQAIVTEAVRAVVPDPSVAVKVTGASVAFTHVAKPLEPRALLTVTSTGSELVHAGRMTGTTSGTGHPPVPPEKPSVAVNCCSFPGAATE